MHITKRIIMTVMVIGLITGSITSPILVGAESPVPEGGAPLQSQIEALQQGQQAIRDDLKAIKELLTARGKRPSRIEKIDLSFSIVDVPAKGQADAPLTLVEFTDYQCPYCSRHSQKVLPQLIKDFVDTGKVRYVLRDFPLTSIHPHAVKAHEAAHCAGEQSKYWEVHDELFANQKELQADKLAGYATAAGVADATAFKACLDSGKYEGQTKAGLAEGSKAGIRGTPSFVLGRTETNGTVKAVKLIRGAQGLSMFKEQIQALLDGKGD